MSLTFDALVEAVRSIDANAVSLAGRKLQQLTLVRAWLIGTWIVTFEEAGAGRAAYGDRLLERLADRLGQLGHPGLSIRNLYNWRRVARCWPNLPVRTLLTEVTGGPDDVAWVTPAQILQTSAESSGDAPLATRVDPTWTLRLFRRLSYSHLLELSRIEDQDERSFYELHTLTEGWALRELIRQRNSALYQRVGLSTHREAVLALARTGRIDERPESLLRDPYVLEFIGLGQAEVVLERDLEAALIGNLQRFLLELGRDFCFVGQQVRITVGNRHHHLDLLFFHRRLRCLVAVDLKIGEFEPEHAGQMRFYLRWLAEEMTHEGENPPIGLVLCSARDAEVVHYATAGDDDLFVSRYRLDLPSEETLRQWLHEARAMAIAQRPDGEE